jgi:hypothetical protein
MVVSACGNHGLSIDENRLVFMKTEETGLERFLRFIENRLITI